MVTLQGPHGPPRPLASVRLDGGRRCLDFVNTIHDRTAEQLEDYLATPDRYVQWCKRVGLIGARAKSPDTPQVLRDVHALRDGLYDVFSARVDHRSPAQQSVSVVDRWLHQAWAQQHF